MFGTTVLTPTPDFGVFVIDDVNDQLYTLGREVLEMEEIAAAGVTFTWSLQAEIDRLNKVSVAWVNASIDAMLAWDLKDVRYVVCRFCGYEKVAGEDCGLPCV